MRSFERRHLPGLAWFHKRLSGAGLAVAPGEVIFRSSSFVNYANGRTDTEITAPDDIEDLDDLLIIFEIGANNPPGPPAPTPPLGFNIVNGFPLTRADSNGFTVDTYAWRKTAAAEAGNYTVAHANASTNAYMQAAFGQNLVTPYAPNPTTATGLGDTATAPGLITPANNCLIVYGCSKWSFPGITPPGGVTPVLTTRLDGSVTLLFISTGNLAVAGATGNKIATNLPNSPTEPWATWLISIQPA